MGFLHTMFTQFGVVQRISISQKPGLLQVMCQYPDAPIAALALAQLAQKQILLGPPHLNMAIEVQFSNLEVLIVRVNSDRTRDFTGSLDAPVAGQASGNARLRVAAMAAASAAVTAGGFDLPGVQQRATTVASALVPPPGVQLAAAAATSTTTAAATSAASSTTRPPPGVGEKRGGGTSTGSSTGSSTGTSTSTSTSTSTGTGTSTSTCTSAGTNPDVSASGTDVEDEHLPESKRARKSTGQADAVGGGVAAGVAGVTALEKSSAHCS
eukprot:COSAG05_NODE_2389_length_3130_cov_3.157374_3_plen_268_part_00